MKFIKKLKNNNAGAESAMFCMGCMIFLIILVFSFDIFKLTWQRYVDTREAFMKHLVIMLIMINCLIQVVKHAIEKKELVHIKRRKQKMH